MSVNLARIYPTYLPKAKTLIFYVSPKHNNSTRAQLCSRDLLTADELIKVDQKLVSELVQKIIS